MIALKTFSDVPRVPSRTNATFNTDTKLWLSFLTKISFFRYLVNNGAFTDFLGGTDALDLTKIGYLKTLVSSGTMTYVSVATKAGVVQIASSATANSGAIISVTNTTLQSKKNNTLCICNINVSATPGNIVLAGLLDIGTAPLSSVYFKIAYISSGLIQISAVVGGAASTVTTILVAGIAPAFYSYQININSNSTKTLFSVFNIDGSLVASLAVDITTITATTLPAFRINAYSTGTVAQTICQIDSFYTKEGE
jgi:hypothetical protein